MSQTEPDNGPSVRRVLVGVSAGIAAYKSPELVRRLREGGADVRVVMTAGARHFITPLTLQAVSGHRVRETLLDPEAEAGMGHIELARWADDLVIAPTTADLIGRLAGGLADDLVTTTAMATTARVWLAPAMNRVMWEHPAVKANLETLKARGVRLLGPDSGGQACGETGYGRMLEPDEIAAALMDRGGALVGKRFVVTAGPTHEPLDPVRFIGNRSSGRMGFAVAAALAEAGAEVELIAGPVALETPRGVTRIDVRTAEEMLHAVEQRLPADGFIGVAAVADYRPSAPASSKIKRRDAAMTLELEPNPDILGRVAASNPRPFTVGFAAETDDLERHARGKLEQRGLDLVAANRVGPDAGFDRPDNALLVLSPSRRWELERASKAELAHRLVEIVAGQMQERKT